MTQERISDQMYQIRLKSRNVINIIKRVRSTHQGVSGATGLKRYIIQRDKWMRLTLTFTEETLLKTEACIICDRKMFIQKLHLCL